MVSTTICITLDVDSTWYAAGGGFTDEMAVVFPTLWKTLQRHPNVKTTWFVRLDKQMAAVHGAADYTLLRHHDAFAELRRAGHEVGWHPHCYDRVGTEWKQNTDGPSVLAELEQHTATARAHGMNCVRMGWGFHTNDTMRFLAQHGFLVDSSAIPRPRYSWEESQKDWTVTPSVPYFPAQVDYRIPGTPAWSILEIPMSVAHISAGYDREKVLRYFNPAFHPEALREPLQRWFEKHSHLVTITHPYELASGSTGHGLLSFSIDAFEENLLAIQRLGGLRGQPRFLTVSEFATLYGVSAHGSTPTADSGMYAA